MTPIQSTILNEIKAVGMLRYMPASLQKKHSIKASELNKTVKELIKMGLIERKVNKLLNNGRYSTITILKIK